MYILGWRKVVKSSAQEYNVITPVRTQIRTACYRRAEGREERRKR